MKCSIYTTFLFLFIVRVIIPMAKDVVYRAKEVRPMDVGSGYYELLLEDDRIAYVPMMATVIEWRDGK